MISTMSNPPRTTPVISLPHPINRSHSFIGTLTTLFQGHPVQLRLKDAGQYGSKSGYSSFENARNALAHLTAGEKNFAAAIVRRNDRYFGVRLDGNPVVVDGSVPVQFEQMFSNPNLQFRFAATAGYMALVDGKALISNIGIAI